MEVVKVKKCIACSRLLTLDVLQCPCGGTEFIEVIVNFGEEEADGNTKLGVS